MLLVMKWVTSVRAARALKWLGSCSRTVSKSYMNGESQWDSYRQIFISKDVPIRAGFSNLCSIRATPRMYLASEFLGSRVRARVAA